MATHKILIVDDTAKNIQLAANILRQEGFNIAYATTANGAFEKLKNISFDLILLDSIMPDMAGIDLYTKIKTEFPPVPVIFLITHSEEKNIQDFFEIGVADYIYKPFNPNELIARVNTQIKLHAVQNSCATKQTALNISQSLNAQLLAVTNRTFHQLFEAGENLQVQLRKEDRNTPEILPTLIKKHAQSLTASSLLFDNLLWMEKLERKQVFPKESVCFLNQVVENCLQKLEADIQTKALQVTNWTEPVALQCDEQIVGHIVYNLLSNAVKYAPVQGEITIKNQSKKGKAQLHICDNGFGLTDDVLGKALSDAQFFSTPGTNQEVGHGFGLKICYRLLAFINAKLEIEGSLGKGTCCLLKLL